LGSDLIPVRQARVEPLAREKIEEFLTRHLPERGAAVWSQIRRSQKQVELYSTPFFLRLLVEQVQDPERIPTGQAELLTGFVRSALRRETERRAALFRPGELLNRDDLRQINQHDWGPPYYLPAGGALISRLESLAFKMQDGGVGEKSGLVRLPEAAAVEYLAHPRAGDILEAGLQLNVLDKDFNRERRPPGPDLFFFHQLIQEYFAGRVLACAPQPERVYAPWHSREMSPSLADTVAALGVGDPLPPLPATGWEETTLLAAAMAPDQEPFVDLLAIYNLPLAARAAAAPEVQVSDGLAERIQKELLERIDDAGADLRARIAAAEALGDLGDPRFERREGQFGAYLLPPLIPIPGGTYTIGDDNGEYNDEKPAHHVEVADFEISVFPVTNAEYRQFMDAKPYDDEHWWDAEAARAWRRGEASNEGPKAQWRLNAETLRNNWTEEEIEAYPSWTPEQKRTYLWFRRATAEELERQLEEWYPTGVKYKMPGFWEDSRFNHPSRPVVGVTWYEARGYCAWLSAQTGETFGLPTEAEWEAAARGPEGRPYAYGDEYDPAKCNTFDTHIRTTTPVGVFPAGRTPQGVHDLTGNVWEWTSTIYRDYPYAADDGREEVEPADALARRGVRGGSWALNRQLARAVYRYGYPPEDRGSLSGFRVVRRRRPPSQ
jgi:formylglycine-generating enzyme required for sulfatase activity